MQGRLILTRWRSEIGVNATPFFAALYLPLMFCASAVRAADGPSMAVVKSGSVCSGIFLNSSGDIVVPTMSGPLPMDGASEARRMLPAVIAPREIRRRTAEISRQKPYVAWSFV